MMLMAAWVVARSWPRPFSPCDMSRIGGLQKLSRGRGSLHRALELALAPPCSQRCCRRRPQSQIPIRVIAMFHEPTALSKQGKYVDLLKRIQISELKLPASQLYQGTWRHRALRSDP